MTNGEDAILDILGKYFPNFHPHLIMGRGDDCALITIPFSSAFQNVSASPCSSDSQNIVNHSPDTLHGSSHILAVTSDIFTENSHFRSRYFTPAQIGHKALAVNISDLAANGARPSAFSLNLTLSDRQDFAWLEEFFASMAKLSQRFNMGLSGGDLAKTSSENISGLNIGITAWGDYGHGGIPLLRHKSYAPRNYAAHDVPHDVQNKLESQQDFCQDFCFAQEGDYIFVIGEIGLARTGLFNLESTANAQEVQEIIKRYPAACNAHLNPMPLVYEGLFLSQFAIDYPIFLMDISDGLMRDLPRLLSRQGIIEKGNKCFGAKIDINENDINQEICIFAKSIKQDPAYFAYSGGEDYGLLGICPPEAWGKLQEKWQENKQFARLWKIGELCKDELTLNNIEIKEHGFDHFQK